MAKAATKRRLVHGVSYKVRGQKEPGHFLGLSLDGKTAYLTADGKRVTVPIGYVGEKAGSRSAIFFSVTLTQPEDQWTGMSVEHFGWQSKSRGRDKRGVTGVAFHGGGRDFTQALADIIEALTHNPDASVSIRLHGSNVDRKKEAALDARREARSKAEKEKFRRRGGRRRPALKLVTV